MASISLSRDQVRAYDKYAIERIGIPSIVLMENAGRGTADVLCSLGIHGQVVVCCGKGNNGGDGLVIARHLANRRHDVAVLLFASPDSLSADAKIEWNIIRNMRVSTRIFSPDTIDDLLIDEAFKPADWIVDALFGTGLIGPLRPPFDHVVKRINSTGKRVLAVDIPSGMNCDTGEAQGETIRANHTVTFVAPKLGFSNPLSRRYTGLVHVVDIGIVLHSADSHVDCSANS